MRFNLWNNRVLTSPINSKEKYNPMLGGKRSAQKIQNAISKKLLSAAIIKLTATTQATQFPAWTYVGLITHHFTMITAKYKESIKTTPNGSFCKIPNTVF